MSGSGIRENNDGTIEMLSLRHHQPQRSQSRPEWIINKAFCQRNVAMQYSCGPSSPQWTGASEIASAATALQRRAASARVRGWLVEGLVLEFRMSNSAARPSLQRQGKDVFGGTPVDLVEPLKNFPRSWLLVIADC